MASVVAEHQTVRAAVGGAMPDKPTVVSLYAAGGHLTTVTQSVVATRNADDRWHFDARGRSRIWVEDAPFVPMPAVERDLSPEAGSRLDAILADPCFWAEPPHLSGLTGDGPPPRGIFVVTLAAVAAGHRRTADLIGPVQGLTGEIERLLQP